MLLLLERHKGNRFTLYCPEIYGLETWGSNTQLGMEKARKSWYTTYWSYRGEYCDDCFEKTRLNIVLETYNINEIIDFVLKHNKKELMYIINAYASFSEQYVKFLKWIYKPKEG